MPVKADDTDWGVIGGTALVGAGTGAVLGTAVADGPGAVVGAAVGGVWGAVAGYFMQDKSDAAIYSGAKGVYADNVMNATKNYLTISSTNAQNDINNSEAWQLYYARKAEWGALQLYQRQAGNGTSLTYNPYKVLSYSEVANGTLATPWKIATDYEVILNSNADLSNSFVGTYQGLTWTYYLGSTMDYSVSSSIDNNNPMRVKVLYQITVDQGNDKWASFSAGSPILIINSQTSERTEHITLTNRYNEVVYDENVTLGPSQVTYVSVPVSGEYKIGVDSAAYQFFALCSHGLSSTYTLTPKIMAFAQNSSGAVIRLSATWPSVNNGNWEVYGMGISDCTVPKISFAQIYTDMAAILTKVDTLKSQANAFAQAYYNSLVSSGGADNRVMPDVVFPDPDALNNMSAEEIEGIYLAYLQTAKNWFANYSVMNPDNVNISYESLHIKVRGAIYKSDGTMLYDSLTIFTPYVSLADMHLVIGRNNMTQPGFAVKWGSASSLSELTKLSDITYISLAVGDYFIIEEMQLDGKNVTTADLTVHTVQYATLKDGDLGGINGPQGATDAEYLLAHWYWFAVIIGVILCLAWIPTRNIAVGILGLIVLAAGAIGWLMADSSTTTGLLSWLFDMKRGGL